MRSIAKIMVEIEYADGATMTFKVTGHEGGRVHGEFSLDREPVEDLDAMASLGFGWRVMKPSPTARLTLSAAGAIEMSQHAAPPPAGPTPEERP